MNTTNAPESLTCSRSAKIAGTARNGTSVPVPPVPPPYRAERAGTPGQTWLTDRVETSRRAARNQICPRCGGRILVGPDDDTCAATARVDLDPATALEEVAARLAGRFSFELRGGRLHYRDDFAIRGRRNNNPILLDHECETAVLF